MPTDANFTSPRRRINLLWWLAGGFLLIFLLFVFQLFGPNPRIVVAPQTTYITEPLARDGLPDYERYVLELYRDGVTPENNAAVLLLEALWPAEYTPADFPFVIAELGWEQLPSGEDSLVRLHSRSNEARVGHWLRRQLGMVKSTSASADAEVASPTDGAINEEEWAWDPIGEMTERVLDHAMSRPWTSEQIPPLAKWIAENDKPLALILEASHRPRCYIPSPTLLNNKRESLIMMLLPGQQAVRETARALSARAMWHLGEGRLDEAWSDLAAMHRIARLLAQGHTMVEQLIGMAIQSIACEQTVTLLDHGQLSPEQAKAIQSELAALEPFSHMPDSIDRMERAGYLDAVSQFARGTGENIDGIITGNGDATGFSVFNAVSVDWNIVLRKGNEFYDRYAAAARLPTHAERAQVWSQINADLMRLESDLRRPANLFAAAVTPSGRSDAIAGVMISLLLPALDAAMYAQERTNTMFELTRLAAALAVYRAEHGAYPEELDDLVPDVLPSLPVDLYNLNPYVYRRIGDDYLVYSTGRNGADDGGSNEQMSVLKGRPLQDLDLDQYDKLQPQIPAGADDLSIRVPRPKFELPKLPAKQP